MAFPKDARRIAKHPATPVKDRVSKSRDDRAATIVPRRSYRDDRAAMIVPR